MKKRKVIELYPKQKKGSKLKLSIIIITTFLVILSATIYNFCIKLKCKDINYSIEYNLTSKIKSEDRLLNIRKKETLFESSSSITIKVTGMSKKPPHGTKSIEASFIKDKNDIWLLENYK